MTALCQLWNKDCNAPWGKVCSAAELFGEEAELGALSPDGKVGYNPAFRFIRNGVVRVISGVEP